MKMTPLILSSAFLVGSLAAQSATYTQSPVQELSPPGDTPALTQKVDRRTPQGARADRSPLLPRATGPATRTIQPNPLKEQAQNLKGLGNSPDLATEIAPDLAPESMPRPDPARIYWDEQPDKPLWARTRAYKASFGSEGFSYIPFLGSQAPKNYPLSLQLRSVRTAGESHPIADKPVASREGQRVVLDHGSVQVAYTLEPQTIEQWVHLGPAQGTGEIELIFDVHSELRAEPAGTGWYFAGDHGGVNFGQAIVFDEAGKTQVLEVQVQSSELRMVIPSAFVAQSTGELTVDPVISTQLVDAFATSDFTQPDVAYGEVDGMYCVVYEEDFSFTDSDVYSVLVSSSTGVVSLGGYINSNSDSWAKPAIAYNRFHDVFMVVAQALDSGDSEFDIRGRTRTGADNAIAPEFIVEAAFPGSSQALNPDIGGEGVVASPSYFGIVYERDYGTDRDVIFALQNFDGTPESTLLSMHTALDQDLSNPSISDSTGVGTPTSRWNISWEVVNLSGFAQTGLKVLQVRFDGMVTAGPFFATSDPTEIIYSHAISDSLPELAPGTVDPYYIVTYDDIGNAGTELTVVLCAGDQVLDSIELPRTEHTDTLLDRDNPAIATTAFSWIVAYAEELGSSAWNIRCATLQPVVGKLGLVEAPFEVDSIAGRQFDYQNLAIGSARSAGSSSNFSVAFLAYSSETIDQVEMRGARVFADEAISAAGYQYCNSNPNSTGERALIYSLGTSSATSTKLIRTVRMPPGEFCYLLAGTDIGFVPNPGGSVGNLCLGGLLGRYNLVGEIANTGASGTFDFNVDPTAFRTAGGSTVGMAGQTWYFQSWFRDTPAGSGLSNLSNGVAIPLE